jgi:hypothetical protein
MKAVVNNLQKFDRKRAPRLVCFEQKNNKWINLAATNNLQNAMILF